jgi:hypothetical protein
MHYEIRIQNMANVIDEAAFDFIADMLREQRIIGMPIDEKIVRLIVTAYETYPFRQPYKHPYLETIDKTNALYAAYKDDGLKGRLLKFLSTKPPPDEDCIEELMTIIRTQNCIHMCRAMDGTCFKCGIQTKAPDNEN